MIATTLDVFCDGPANGPALCSEWVRGVVGGTPEAARFVAAEHGWGREFVSGKQLDLCPQCLAEIANR